MRYGLVRPSWSVPFGWAACILAVCHLPTACQPTRHATRPHLPSASSAAYGVTSMDESESRRERVTVDLRIERVTQELSIQDSFGSGQDTFFAGQVSHVVVVAPEGYRGVRFVVRHDAARPSCKRARS